jgi:hypothetical protein
MSGYGPLDPFTQFVFMLVVVLSVMVRRIGLSARRRTVAEGEARAEDLAELTGLRDQAALQEAFGPPDMQRVWRQATLADIHQARTREGRWLAGGWLDYASLGAAALPFVLHHPLAEMALILAIGAQILAWFRTRKLPR